MEMSDIFKRLEQLNRSEKFLRWHVENWPGGKKEWEEKLAEVKREQSEIVTLMGW